MPSEPVVIAPTVETQAVGAIDQIQGIGGRQQPHDGQRNGGQTPVEDPNRRYALSSLQSLSIPSRAPTRFVLAAFVGRARSRYHRQAQTADAQHGHGYARKRQNMIEAQRSCVRNERARPQPISVAIRTAIPPAALPREHAAFVEDRDDRRFRSGWLSSAPGVWSIARPQRHRRAQTRKLTSSSLAAVNKSTIRSEVDLRLHECIGERNGAYVRYSLAQVDPSTGMAGKPTRELNCRVV